jgi:hypothetical protein
MCVSLLVASTLVSAVGGAVQYAQTSAAAESEAAFRNYQLDVQNKQLEEDRRLAELQALETENQRRDRAREIRAANEAYTAGSGVGENRSFLQGSGVAADAALRQDITNIRLQGSVARGRITDQIGVNRVEQQFAMQRASMIGSQAASSAIFGTIGSGITNAYRYNQYKTTGKFPIV